MTPLSPPPRPNPSYVPATTSRILALSFLSTYPSLGDGYHKKTALCSDNLGSSARWVGVPAGITYDLVNPMTENKLQRQAPPVGVRAADVSLTAPPLR